MRDAAADQDEDSGDDGGTPPVVCPICSAPGLLGEAGCPHWFASGGSDGQAFGRIPATDAIAALGEILEQLTPEERERLTASAPAEIASVLRAVGSDEGGAWWEDLPGVERSEEVEVDEASGTWGYWDYFHADPDFPGHAVRLADAALAWLRKQAPAP